MNLEPVKTCRIHDTQVAIWSDGSLTIDSLRLSNSKARALRKFLNKPPVKQLLGIATSSAPQQGEPRPVNLGEHVVEVAARSITVGNHQGMVPLDEAETYRLFVTLRELYSVQAS